MVRSGGTWGTGQDGWRDLGGRAWTSSGALGDGPGPAVGPWGTGPGGGVVSGVCMSGAGVGLTPQMQ